MNKPKFDFAVGGQALIEGVMMRSKNFIAMAVRKQDGSIKIEDFAFNSFIQKHKWANIPILRGAINMIEMLIVGTKAINFSSNEFIEDEEPTAKEKEPSKFTQSLLLILNLIFALGFTILIFKFLPLYLTELISKVSPQIDQNFIAYNAIDGILKILIFILYVLLIMISKTVRRVFEFHGAEHKAVFNYEEGSELTVENSRKQSRFHPRCGTSFIIFVFVISVIVYTFIPRHPDFLIHFLRRIAILPIIAGISYEVLKLSAKYEKNPIIKLFIIPGLLFQRLTTKEPDDAQLEVAIASLKRTLELENAKS